MGCQRFSGKLSPDKLETIMRSRELVGSHPAEVLGVICNANIFPDQLIRRPILMKGELKGWSLKEEKAP
jgi:hypothetical protein